MPKRESDQPPAKVVLRREKIKKMIVRGIPNAKIIETLKVAQPTFYNDLKEIREEINASLRTEPIEKILMELILTTDTSLSELWSLYYRTENDNVKLGAQNSIIKVMSEKIKILQSLGIIREAPQKIELNTITYEDIQNALKEQNEIKKQWETEEETEDENRQQSSNS